MYESIGPCTCDQIRHSFLVIQTLKTCKVHLTSETNAMTPLKNTLMKGCCTRMGGLIILLIFILGMLVLINRETVISENPCPSCSSESKDSLCSRRATDRGPGQKIIAISLFGAVENVKMFASNRSFVLLDQLVEDIRNFFADQWILRVYHDQRVLNKVFIDEFQSRYTFVDFCNIDHLNLSFVPPKIWRFLPAGDPTVSVMMSRDLDSPLTSRERAAIDEWLASTLPFHSMRDHPFHAAPIMGGMWAFYAEKDRTFARQFRKTMFNPDILASYPLNKDQQFLSDHLWNYASSRAMSHASYWCEGSDWNAHHRPFPTRRPKSSQNNYTYIGCPRRDCSDEIFAEQPCPVECRPEAHPDWLSC